MIDEASRCPLTEEGRRRTSCFIRWRTSSEIDAVWRGFCPVQTTKKSVYEQAGRMSRMTTFCASLSWARPAMRWACSSEFSAISVHAVEFRSVAVASVEPE